MVTDVNYNYCGGIQISNHRVIHLKLICFMSTTPQSKIKILKQKKKSKTENHLSIIIVIDSRRL